MTSPLSDRRPGARAYWYVLGVLWLLPALAVVVGSLVLPDENADGQCTGIGFGCSVTPADGVGLAAAFAAPFLGIGGLLGMVLLALLRDRPAFARMPPSLQALAVLAVLVAAAVGIAVAVLD
ncbi:hypothetical protein [Blastococcus xanthinilyticus]|uniref:Uncharacterized protein n=1 Tax=Blastococcus xanthinilyticus TaxID=1564164 RepID=A0A5S5CTS1_9ACTN|nr:hypothetical protein [Blastococcus xanthinilyticus]TYP85952.1 hypothetical protein BD833_11193 [Blastococcus xanthinilyticus]